MTVNTVNTVNDHYEIYGKYGIYGVFKQQRPVFNFGRQHKQLPPESTSSGGNENMFATTTSV